MIRFDAYSATTKDAKPEQLMELLADAVGLDALHKVRQGKGFHTFGERISVADESGSEWASVSWGGRQGDWAMLEVKGERTPMAVEALRERFWHRCTRVDSCADFDAPRAFDRLRRACMTVKKAHRIMGERRGTGRTFLRRGERSTLDRLNLPHECAFMRRANSLNTSI